MRFLKNLFKTETVLTGIFIQYPAPIDRAVVRVLINYLQLPAVSFVPTNDKTVLQVLNVTDKQYQQFLAVLKVLNFKIKK